MSQLPASSRTDTTTDSPDASESNISPRGDESDASTTEDPFPMDAPGHLQVSGEVQVFDHIFAAAGAVADTVRFGLPTSTSE
jgi:proliferating cell nuclear antigen